MSPKVEDPPTDQVEGSSFILGTGGGNHAPRDLGRLELVPTAGLPVG